VVLEYGSWELYGNKSWYMDGRSLGHFSFKSSNIGAVYEHSTFCIIHSDRTVPDEVVGKEMYKKFP